MSLFAAVVQQKYHWRCLQAQPDPLPDASMRGLRQPLQWRGMGAKPALSPCQLHWNIFTCMI